MKKIWFLLLCLAVLLTTCGCAKEYVLSEEAYNKNSWYTTYKLNGISYDLAKEMYFEIYPTDETVIYFPVGGEYRTRTGKKFTAVVGETCGIWFVEDTTHSRISFDISIYDKDGNLIVKKNRFCSYVQVGTKKMDLTYVSEEFREYWKIIAVRLDQLED